MKAKKIVKKKVSKKIAKKKKKSIKVKVVHVAITSETLKEVLQKDLKRAKFKLQVVKTSIEGKQLQLHFNESIQSDNKVLGWLTSRYPKGVTVRSDDRKIVVING